MFLDTNIILNGLFYQILTFSQNPGFGVGIRKRFFEG